MNAIACTLYEGEYHYGVGVLANSLYLQGYRGTFCIGYRGSLPPWAPDADTFVVANDFTLNFVRMPDGTPMAHLKPSFMRQILDDLEPEAESVLFFDADALVLADWSFFVRWSEEAVAIVADLWFPRISRHHPWRRAWRQLAVRAGYEIRDCDEYHGSAFLGVSRGYRVLLDRWCDLTEALYAQRPEMRTRFQAGDRMTDPFFGTDQDLLAAALMACDVPICAHGPEAFGFTGHPCIMLHPTGSKPWRSGAWKRTLQGRRPDLYEGSFWRHLATPIEVMDAPRRYEGLFRYRLAHGLSRLYGG